MPKKEAWLSIQAVTLFTEMWDAKPRNHEFTLAAIRSWTRYLTDDEAALRKTRKRAAATLVREFVAEARPHYGSSSWKVIQHHITLAISKRLTQSSASEIHRNRHEY